jgi:hypothetical protein
MHHPFGATAFFLTILSILKTAGSIHGRDATTAARGGLRDPAAITAELRQNRTAERRTFTLTLAPFYLKFLS